MPAIMKTQQHIPGHGRVDNAMQPCGSQHRLHREDLPNRRLEAEIARRPAGSSSFRLPSVRFARTLNFMPIQPLIDTNTPIRPPRVSSFTISTPWGFPPNSHEYAYSPRIARTSELIGLKCGLYHPWRPFLFINQTLTYSKWRRGRDSNPGKAQAFT